MARRGLNAKSFIAMRYWHPMSDAVVAEVKNYAPDHIILLPLYPQYSKATTESSVKEWKKQLAKRGASEKIEWSLIEHYYDFPPYLDAFVERINQGLEKFPADRRDKVDILFSAHGTPMKLALGIKVVRADTGGPGGFDPGAPGEVAVVTVRGIRVAVTGRRVSPPLTVAGSFPSLCLWRARR